MELSAQQKFLLFILALGLGVTAFFLIWLFIFNTGKLQLIGPAPYQVVVDSKQNENCAASSCEYKLPTGSHTLVITKDGYSDLTLIVNVSAFSKTTQKVEPEYIPLIQKIDKNEIAQVFDEQNKISKSALQNLPTKKVFYSGEYIAYLTTDSDTQKQALIYAKLLDNVIGEKVTATYFAKPFKDYDIYSSISDSSQIAVVAKNGQTSDIYIVNLQNQFKEKVLTLPDITNFKWDQTGGNFLVQSNLVYYFAASDKKLTALSPDLKLNLSEIIEPGILLAIQNGNLVRYNISQQVSRVLVELPKDFSPKLIKLNPEKTRLYLTDGLSGVVLILKENG